LEKLKNNQPGHIQSISQFFDTISNGGDLPSFAYLEPAWNLTTNDGIEFANGNDYHPPANLCPGEVMLLKIYNALTKYKNWEETLFIVTFDEHGGNFDHVIPPDTIAPDEMNVAGFDFKRLGIRVPTLLISPRIKEGMVFRPEDKSRNFDHTSFLKTILGWQGIDISGGVLGARAAVAPDFSGVLSSIPVNKEIPPLAPDPACVSFKDLDAKLSGFQRWLFPSLAYSIVGGKHGSAEHRRVLSELQSLNTVSQLKDYVEKERKKRISK
jgi:phospholipase C